MGVFIIICERPKESNPNYCDNTVELWRVILEPRHQPCTFLSVGSKLTSYRVVLLINKKMVLVFAASMIFANKISKRLELVYLLEYFVAKGSMG